MRIKTRFYLVVIVAILLGVSCTAVVNYVIFRDALISAMIDREKAAAMAMAGEIATANAAGNSGVTKRLAEKYGYSFGRSLLLADGRGNILSAAGAVPEKISPEPGGVMDSIGHKLNGFIDTGETMIFFAKVPGLGAHVLSCVPRRDFYSPLFMLRNANALVHLLILLAGVLCAKFFSHSIILRLERGARYAGAVAAGDLSGRLEAGRDELGVMFNAFNIMADHLRSAIESGNKSALEAKTASREFELQNARLEILIAERTKELEEAQKHTQLLLDMAEEAMIEMDEETKIKFANEATLRILGYSAEELRGRKFFETVKHCHTAGTICENPGCALRRVVSLDERTTLHDIFIISKRGGMIPASVTVSPANPGDPNSGTAIAIIDFSQPRQRLQEILDSSPITMAVICDGEVRQVNDRGTAAFGLRPGDHVRKMFADVEQKEKILSAIDRGETLRDYPIKMRGADGKLIDALFTLHPFEYEGKPSLLEWISDVTDLTRAKTVAEDAAKARTLFLATMSHEIRTPLNAILGLSEVEMRNGLPDETHSNIEKIYNSGATLMSLVNDILDLSKIDSGKFDIVPAPYDFTNLISDTIHQNVIRLAGKPVKFEPSIDETTPAKLIGDELRIRQVLNNILSNAFKYTREGTVTMQVSCERAGGKAMMSCCVRDTGIGIKPEDIGNLFNEYKQFDKMANRKIEGTGLGLFICKKLVELMGGTIEAESEYGAGTTFTVRIEQGIADPAPIGPETARGLRTFRLKENNRARSLVYKPMSHGKVLVVDDVITNLEVARALMTPYKLTVHCLPGGKQAIETIREGKIEYDVIFMDHMMPEIDGVETVRVIRGEIGTDYAKNIPIIALTANALAGNEDMFLKNGFQAFLSKPIDVIKLDRLLCEWIPDKPIYGESGAETPENRETAAETAPSVPRIKGMDVEEGAIHHGSAEIYAKILGTYARHIPELAEKLRNPSPESLRDYAITIHGIKGASLNVYARDIAAKAEFLEKAAHEGDYAAVAANNGEFIKELGMLIADIKAALAAIEEPPADKRTRSIPDVAQLRRLAEMCKKYDSKGMEKTVLELGQFSYDKHGELVDWLAEQARNLEYDKITDRLENNEAWMDENAQA
ncbi:MAG: PAS domain S-box protein [Synergistaceae bacterium]|jgi:PAS domain S-box-containing protein|nr:PAS domain S-box protein [Synergistaceae bacterium]